MKRSEQTRAARRPAKGAKLPIRQRGQRSQRGGGGGNFPASLLEATLLEATFRDKPCASPKRRHPGLGKLLPFEARLFRVCRTR